MKQISVNHHSKKGCSTITIILLVVCLFPFFYGYLFYILYSKWTYLALFVFLLWRYRHKIISKIKGQEIIKTKVNPEVFSINGETEIRNPYAGIFISGGAGSGKSKSLIEPLIKESGKKDYTGVIYDFKFPELAQYVETAYQTSDIKRYYFNFEDL